MFLRAAEWEPHRSTWIGWPHNRHDWPGKFSAIHWVFGEMVRRIAADENVSILVQDEVHEKKARGVLTKNHTDLTNVTFFRIKTNRGWTRDLGPIFVKDTITNRPTIINFAFNAWANYTNFDLDDAVAPTVGTLGNTPVFEPIYRNRRFVLEGGAIDVNGQGDLLTTEECLLDQQIQVRNQGFSKTETERVLGETLGAKNVIWLNKGIVGDDTHGHVDDICRFVNPSTVVLCSEPNESDENHRILKENFDRISGIRLSNLDRLTVVPLPMPAPLVFDRIRLPASYANFYITNRSVLVPTFNDPNDRIALGILSELFSDRTVIGISAVDLIWGFGAIHCLTNEEPQ